MIPSMADLERRLTGLEESEERRTAVSDAWSDRELARRLALQLQIGADAGPGTPEHAKACELWAWMDEQLNRSDKNAS